MKKPAQSAKTPPRAPVQTEPSPSQSRRPPTPVDASPASPEPKLQSLGRQLLAAQGKGAAELGRQLQCSRGMAHAWLTGRKQPGPAARARLEALGIPPGSWSEAASDESATAPAGSARPQARRAAGRERRAGAPPATQAARIDDGGLGEIEDLLAHVRAARRDPKLLAGERLKAAQEESKLLAHRARLEHLRDTREQGIVNLCVRHPRWQELRDTIIAALVPHRAAALAVFEAVRRHPGVDWREPS